MRVTFLEWRDSAGSRPAAAALGPDEIQVWTAAVPPDSSELAALARVLSAEERRRAERFLVDPPRRQFVFCRALLRHLAGACLDRAPEALRFGVHPLGKPFVEQPSPCGDFRFNLSHSGALAAVVLARGHEVGVDLELIRPLHDVAALAGRIFSPDELDAWHALPVSRRSEAFYTAWTRKEAYLKATGEGMTGGLRAVEVSLVPGAVSPLLMVPGGSAAAARWTMRDLPLPPGYAGALAFESRASTW